MTTLKVQRRNMETKAKKLRREGYVTGNLFGKEFEGSIPLQIEKGEADRIQRECMKGSQLYLELEGTTYDVLIKELDFNALDHQILEMDFQALVKGEKVHSVAEVILHNKEKVPEGILEQHLEEIAYKATPENLVEKIEIDCTGMHIGDVDFNLWNIRNRSQRIAHGIAVMRKCARINDNAVCLFKISLLNPVD